MSNTEPGHARPILPDYDSPQALRSLLEAEGLAMSKRFGQNFLIDRRSRERILEELEAENGERAWEIGPGIGAMTALALDSGLELTVFEIDHGFSRLLSRLFGDRPGFRLVEGDFLDTWRGELERFGPPRRIFGNLPYNAASAFVASLLEGGLIPPRMIFTVQKEGALRMTSKPGSKDYSAFTVLCASTCVTKLAFDLSSKSFWPAPRVTSSVVRMLPRKAPLEAEDRAPFSAFVRSLFASRRKTLRNNLRGISDAELLRVLSDLGIRADVRAEALKPEELAAVYEGIKKLKIGAPRP